MSIAEEIFQGFASAAGAPDAANRIQRVKNDRAATAHEELQANTQDILNNLGEIQGRRKSLDPESPTYERDLAKANSDYDNARQTFHDLYHPAKNPGALQHLVPFLKAHFGQKPEAVPSDPAAARQSIQDRLAEAGKAAGTPATPVNPYTLKKKQILAAGGSQDDVDRAVFGEKDAPPAKYQPQLQETTDADGKKHYWRVPLAQGGQPEEVDFKGQAVTPKAAGGAGGHSKFNEMAGVYEKKWGQPIKEWTPEQLTYFNQKMAYDSRVSGDSTTTRFEKDQDNNIIPITVTNTRGPARPPVEPGTTAPATPGEAKRRASAVAPSGGSSVRVGTPLPFKAMSPAVSSADKDYKDAVKLSSQADLVAQHPTDAVNQKRLAVALERVSAGRFTVQALDYIIKAGWGNTIEQWVNNPQSGALPADVMRQLIDGAHQNMQAADDARKAARGETPPPPPAAAQPSGKAVSLAKAKLLPQMKGKSDDEIRKAIEASGHKVVP